MKLHLTAQDDINLIQRYQIGEITVGGTSFSRSVVITPDQIFEDWQPQPDVELSIRDFQYLSELEADLILLGTGLKQIFPKPELTQCILESSKALEVMDTPAACRTYNILASEQRNVAAALLIPS